MRVMLGSGGFRTSERIMALQQEMRSFFGPVQKLLFVPYALHDHDSYVAGILEKGLDAGYAIEGIHHSADPVRAVEEAEAIYVGGGNTYRLLNSLYQLKLLEVIRRRVLEGMPYLGISAGCNVACPTIQTSNDMVIIMPPSVRALSLVPFQINPHYYTGHHFVRVGEEFIEHFGEMRDDRIREFHEMNDTPVLGLWEAGILKIEDGKATLLNANARLFRKGEDPVDYEPGADMTFLL